MTATTNHWDTCLKDVARLTAQYEVNNLLLDAHPDWEYLILNAFAGPVPDDLAPGTPLLRRPDPDWVAVPLLDVVLGTTILRGTRFCTRCHGPLRASPRPRSILWVPCGQSVVELHMCWFCRAILHDCAQTIDGREILVWR